MNTCTIYFRDQAGQPIGGFVTDSLTVFGAARKALDWFNAPFWQGPKPTADTILEVSTVAFPEKKHFVRAGTLLERG